MDGIGYLVDAIVYFLITVGLTSAAVWRVDEKVALPGTSPWREDHRTGLVRPWRPLM